MKQKQKTLFCLQDSINDDFGKYRNESVESFIEDAAAAAMKHGRVPWLGPTKKQAERAFALLASSNSTLAKSDSLLGIASFSHCGLRASDHFFHDKRMKCSGYNRPSPADAWVIANDKGSKQWKALYGCASRLSRKQPLNAGLLRAATRLSGACYNAAQFKPCCARAIYRFFDAKSILDPCAGWGDRMVASISCGASYVGFDANGGNEEAYRGIKKAYGGNADVSISCFEDADVPKGTFDLAFTSPPYFDTERYASGTHFEAMQSWKRYPTKRQWCDRFLKILVEKCFLGLKDGGVLAINIKNPRHADKCDVDICDELMRFCRQAGLKFIGTIGLELKSAPGNVPLHRPQQGKPWYEPVFCFQKQRGLC